VRSIRWPVWLLGATLVVAAVVSAIYGARYLGRHVSTDDAFVEIPMVFVSSQIGGRVAEVLVEEHQRVDEGEVLVRLDDTRPEIELARADAALAMARNRVVQAQASSASADAERKAAEVEEEQTRRELGRVRSLRAQGATSQSDLDSAQAAYDASVARVRALELRVQAERALVNDDAQVHLAEAERREAALDVQRTVVRAPFAGVVGRRAAQPGAVVTAGQPLVALVSTDRAWVMANFKETQIERLHIGDPVEVTIDAFPDVAWTGHVESFSPATGAEYSLISPEPASGNFTKVVQRVPVRIALPAEAVRRISSGQGAHLATGLSANVDVLVE